MTPTPANTATDHAVLGDCWMHRQTVLRYLDISIRTLREWNRKGKCLPHHVDPDTGKKMWRKRLLDSELSHGSSLIVQGNSANLGRKASEKRGEKSHV